MHGCLQVDVTIDCFPLHHDAWKCLNIAHSGLTMCSAYVHTAYQYTAAQ